LRLLKADAAHLDQELCELIRLRDQVGQSALRKISIKPPIALIAQKADFNKALEDLKYSSKRTNVGRAWEGLKLRSDDPDGFDP
jgi:hypothetical protein